MKNIFLVGMPSSGKSTVGRSLAKLLNYKYLDLDQQIEDSVNKTIPTIFSEDGEAYFREIESKLLKDIEPDCGLIIATGGGAPCFFDNMDFINSNGISVFLDVPVDELVTRIENHGVNDRPLLAKMKTLKTELSAKIEWRYPYYTKADVIISGITDADKVLEKIRHLLN